MVYMFITCSWLVHNLFMCCSWLVHNLLITCSLLVNQLFRLVHKTRSQHYPYLTGQGVKKLVNRTFSTANPNLVLYSLILSCFWNSWTFRLTIFKKNIWSFIFAEIRKLWWKKCPIWNIPEFCGYFLRN